jgi:excisionase family DNA binding protein
MTDAADFLRAGEIARLAGVSVRTVRRWIAEKTLPSVKLRGVRLVPRKDLERMLVPAPTHRFKSEEEI